MGDGAERFTVLFRQHHRQVLAYVLRRAGEAQAEDVVAETFTAAWRHIDRLPEDPLPWLYRTAHNCLSNNRRSARRWERLMNRLTAHHQVVPDHASGVVEEAHIRAALWQLSPGEREALMLISWEGLDVRMAAYVAGCSVSAFKVRLHRARKHLAGVLANDHGRVRDTTR